jgi:hypothetical protein
MNLYLLLRTSSPGYDEVCSFIIRARSESGARIYATANYGDEGPSTWLNKATSTCTLLTTVGKPGIILRDLNPG